MFVLTSLNTQAQTRATTTDLIGTIKDQTNSVIGGTIVTIRNPATNLERVTFSNEDGSYTFLALPPNIYEVTVKADGFDEKKIQVNLILGTSALLDIILGISSPNNIIEVTDTKLIEASKSSITQSIESSRIDNLPINGRNFLGFAFLNSLVGRDAAPIIGPAPTSGLSFAGQRARSNLVQVDGADTIDNSTRATKATVSQEGVQEFQIIINSFEAEYGRTAGGVVNIISKSGTNQFHGNLFGFLRQRAIQARNGLAFQPPGANKKPPFTRGQYGFTFSGPIKQNKLFFLLSLDQTHRQESGFSDIGRDPSVFSLTQSQQSYIANSGAIGQLYAKFALSGLTVARTGIDPYTGLAVFLPTFMASNGKLGTITSAFRPINNAPSVYPISDKFTFYSAKVDYQINENHRLSTRYSFTPISTTGIQTSGQNQPFGLNDVSRTSSSEIRDTGIVVQINSILGKNKLNEFAFNFGRRSNNFTSSSDVAINIPGVGFFGREPFSPVRRVEKSFEFKDSFSYLVGKHTTKFGIDAKYIRLLPFRSELNFSGVFNFGTIAATEISPNFVGAPAFTTAQAYGLGRPQTFIQSFGDPTAKSINSQFGFFAQDSWKLRSNFVINYGLRYDFELTPIYKTSPIKSDRLNLTAKQVDSAERLLNVIQGIPRDYKRISPRIAFAWEPTNDHKTIIRAAYGIFFDSPLLFIATNSAFLDGVDAPIFIVSRGNPLPNGNINATQIFQGTVTSGTTMGIDRGATFLPSQSRFDSMAKFPGYGVLLPTTLPVGRDFKFAYTNQISFSIEREILPNTALQVSYVFTGGRRLAHSVNRNAPDGKRVLKASSIDSVINNFFRPSGPNPVFIKTDSPVPFGNVSTQESSSSSNFNALTVNLNRRLTNNLQLEISYSFSKTIDDSTDLQSLLQPQDNRNPGLERSRSLFDQRHRFIISAVLNSPYKQSESGVKKLLSSFTFSPIIELSSGKPFNILTGTDTNLDQSANTDRPNVDSIGRLTLPNLGEIGSLGRNAGTTPGFANVDLRLTKEIKLGENTKIQFISEAFNLFNRVNVNTVNNNFQLIRFEEGKFKSSATSLFDPRQFQFAIKIYF
jgi:hypothetical protein